MFRAVTPQKKPSDPIRRVPREIDHPDPDPPRTIKTPATESAQHDPPSFSPYVHSPSSAQTNYPTSNLEEPRSSPSWHPELDRFKKIPRRSSGRLTSAAQTTDNALSKLFTGSLSPYKDWLPPDAGLLTPPLKFSNLSIHKPSRGKGKDRDKDTHRGRDRDRSSDTHAWKTSRDLIRDPYDSQQQKYTTAILGRDPKERPDEDATLQPSGNRRYLAEGDTMTLKVSRIFQLFLFTST